MRVLAIDQSLAASGVAWYITACRNPIRSCLTWKPKKLVGMERLAWIKAQLIDELARGADLLVVEGYAPRGINDALVAGELGSTIMLTAHERKIKVLVVPPPSRIRYMTCGAISTRAGTEALKQEAKDSAKRELGVAVSDDNQADALWLAEIGAAYLGAFVPDDPERRAVIAHLRKAPEQVKEEKRIADLARDLRRDEAAKKKAARLERRAV